MTSPTRTRALRSRTFSATFELSRSARRPRRRVAAAQERALSRSQALQISMLSDDDRAPLKAALLERLLTLNFHSFARCIALLLEQAGFTDVQLAGRRDWKGRNGTDGNAGYDLLAQVPGAFGSRPIIVQAKQYGSDQMIFQRSLDEITGVALRTGAREAILITTGRFSPSIQPAGSHATGMVPLRLMDGDGLLDQLLRYQIGVRLKDGAAPWEDGALVLDERFFTEISRSYQGNSRADCHGSGDQQFLVTVAVEPVPAQRSRKVVDKPLAS